MNDTRVFRSSFSRLWKWITGLSALMYLVTGGTLAWNGQLDEEASIAAGAFSLSCGLLFAAAVICFPVYASPNGLRCYNYWGIYATIPWDTITNVRRISVLGLPYLVARSSASSVQPTVPLYLSDMPGFILVVKQFAGDDNPLFVGLVDHSR